MSRLTFFLLALLAFGALAGCNTFRGMGEDIAAAGDALSGKADDTQRQMNGEPEPSQIQPAPIRKVPQGY